VAPSSFRTWLRPCSIGYQTASAGASELQMEGAIANPDDMMMTMKTLTARLVSDGRD